MAALVDAALADLAGNGALTLAEAQRLAQAAEAVALAMGLAIVVAVADPAGAPMLLHRMDGALPASTDIALNKAFTAAAFRMATHELGELAQPGRPLYGVQATNQGRVVLFGGGYPCRRNGAVGGAIGISGGTADQDMRIAACALHTLTRDSGLLPEGGKTHE
ncbi:cobalamin adenosyltransferase [Azospirillum sp. TSO35-2]|nr:cobalamin adenosyltransferase [Azospirillum sp. TSO35-2]